MPPPDPNTDAQNSPDEPRPVDASRAQNQVPIFWTIAAGGWLLLVMVLSALGGPHNAMEGLRRILALATEAGPTAAVYLLGGIGLGRLARPLFRNASDPLALQAGIGLSMQLALSHLLGITGLLAGTTGRAVTVGLAALGLGLLAQQFLRASRERRHAASTAAATSGAEAQPPMPWSRKVLWLIASVGPAILLVAASNPPGWLWDSEFGGYDVLSYHLRLPQEWIAAGRIAPVDHNVYSYLPSYMEAAFVHLAALTGAPARYSADGTAFGLLAGEGSRTISCHFLHVGFAIIAAWMTARLATRLLSRCGLGDRAAGAGSLAAGAFVLVTPWTQVTGSLAYNEMAMLALFAASLIAAIDDGVTPARRALLTGWLIGVACGVKPTALMFCAPPAAIALAATVPARAWLKMIIPGAVAGAVSLAPWLIRNYLVSGNPVFPAMSSIFGTGHWTADQVARFVRGHQFDGSLLNGLRLLVLPDASDPAGSRHRGIMHAQWGLFAPAVLVALLGALLWRPSRKTAWLLAASIAAQTLAWLLTTHLQSRFLMPLLVPGAALFGVAVGAWALGPATVPRSLSPGRALVLVIAQLALAAQAVMALGLYAKQHNEHPNAALIVGPGLLSGNTLRGAQPDITPERWAAETASDPYIYLNLRTPTEPVLLVGDATPFYLTIPARYATTWDTNPLAVAMREHPNDRSAWAASLFPSGSGLVLVNFGEINRLQDSGWFDPTINADAVSNWLVAEGQLIEQWPAQSRAIFRIRARAPLPSAAPATPP